MATSSLGKTTALEGPCEACDTHNAVTLCTDCPVHLCNTCSKGHQKIKATAGHNLVPIAAPTTCTLGSGKAPSLKIACAVHPGVYISLICTHCEEVICDSCQSKHVNHRVVEAREDIQLLQKIGLATLSKLSEQVLHLDSMKIPTDKNINFYLEAKDKIENWRAVIVDCTNESAESLQTALDTKIDARKELLRSRCEDFKNITDKTEAHITKMNSLRRFSDSEILIASIAEGNGILHEGKVTLSYVSVPLYNFKDLLPHMDMLTQLTDQIKKFFSARIPDVSKSLKSSAMCDPIDHGTQVTNIKRPSTKPAGNVDSTNVVNNLPTVDYRTQKIIKKRGLISQNDDASICETVSLHTNYLTFFLKCKTKILYFDMTRYYEHDTIHQAQMDIRYMMSTSPNRYIVKENNKPRIHILGQSFRKIKTLSMDTEKYKLVDMCLLGPDAFMMCRLIKSTHKSAYQLRFSKVSVEQDVFESTELTTVSVKKKPKYIRLHRDKNRVTMVNNKTLYIVDLFNSVVTEHDISKDMSDWFDVNALYVDDSGNALIGCGSLIHVYTPILQHSVIREVVGFVTDITVHNGKLCVGHRETLKIPQISIYG